MPPAPLSSSVRRAAPQSLVVHCSDHRFQAGFYEFLNPSRDSQQSYDLLAIPGGAQCLTLVEYLPKFSWAGRRWLRFLMEAHGPKRLILIAHQDCRWYQLLPSFLHRSADLRQRQEEDLRRVRQLLEQEFPGLAVELYYAGWDSSDRLTVEAIAT